MNRTLAAALLLTSLLASACGGDDDVVDASTPPDAAARGTISMTWRVESGGADASCGDVAAQLVLVEMLRQGDVSGEVDTFNCTAAVGTTRQVLAGTYGLRLDLLDRSTESLLTEQVVRSGVEVTDGNDTSIGEVVFAVQ